MRFPDERIRALIDRPPRVERQYVLYWMIAARRPRFNFALQRAVDYARALQKPLVVLEALRIGYRWASDRLHSFVIEGMADNARHFAKTSALYYPYLERVEGEGSGLLAALAAQAAVVVTDDYPCFFIPRMLAAAATKLDTRLEAIDGNGVLPIALAGGKAFYNAHHFRRFMQRNAAAVLKESPREDPLRRIALPPAKLPRSIGERWPALSARELEDIPKLVSSLAIDHDIPVVVGVEGGTARARRALARFVEAKLGRYVRERSHPDAEVASGLSPYLHFGHLGVHEVLAALAGPEHWDLTPRGLAPAGSREGFWGLSAGAESFLDEVVTFRELSFNSAAFLADFDRYVSLPEWARKTLEVHAGDAREFVYTRSAFEHARTHDELWNAAQRQLVNEGRIQNYLRMLWGKSILAWSKSPTDALETMIELNNKYGLDGRDPNSYAGIFWVLGRYDRPWAPQRPVFGSVRYMSSASAARKLRLQRYLAHHRERANDSQTTITKKKNLPPE